MSIERRREEKSASNTLSVMPCCFRINLTLAINKRFQFIFPLRNIQDSAAILYLPKPARSKLDQLTE